MASALEMFFGGLALLVNTLVILTMWFVYDVTFGPIIKFADAYFAEHPPSIDVSGITYVPSAILGILLILEIILIIAFVAVIFRRETVGDYESGGIA